ncbi:MAG: HIT family protein [Gaiellaceae bacterium]
MAADCLICRQVGGDLVGGLLIDEPLVAGFHLPPLEEYPRQLLGHVMVVPRRHAPGWADLADEEAAATGVAITQLARALRATLDLERVYSAAIGHRVPHLHVHVVPRYQGTPAELGWMESREWEGAPHGATEEIVELVGRLRDTLA